MFGSTAKSGKSGRKNKPVDLPVSEILRLERTRQELQITDIARSLGIPASQLAALEEEQFDIFPSQLAVLTALRQYAKALKLNGDMLALKLLDTLSQHPESILNSADQIGNDETSNLSSNSTDTTVSRSSFQTRSPIYNTNKTAEVPMVQPAGQPSTKNKQQRRQIVIHQRSSTPMPIKLTLFVAIFLVFVGLIGTILEHSKPSWFQSLHTPTLVPTTIPITAPTIIQKTSNNNANFKLTNQSSSSATYQISSSSFNLEVASTGTPWIEVVNNSNSSVIFEGVLASNQTKTFSNLSNVTMQIGSANLSISVQNSSKTLGSIAPTTAPFTYNFISG